jgi:hypothetical protein
VSDRRFIVRTWDEQDGYPREDSFATEAEALAYAEGSRENGWKAEVRASQPDLFEVAS